MWLAVSTLRFILVHSVGGVKQCKPSAKSSLYAEVQPVFAIFIAKIVIITELSLNLHREL